MPSGGRSNPRVSPWANSKFTPKGVQDRSDACQNRRSPAPTLLDHPKTRMPPDIQSEQPSSIEVAAEAPLWRAVGASLRGAREDYTKVSLQRAIVLLAVPMMLELVMESTFGLVDIFFVGKLGSEAVATVGLTGSVIILVFAVAMGLCMGTTAMVSRRIGEGDPVAAGVAAWQAIVLGIIASIPTSIIGFVYAPELLRWMGGSDAVVAGHGYTSVLFAGSVTIFLLFLNNAIFRGAGDAAVAMRVLWVANIINMVLDPLLIFGIGPFPELGLTGAAVATTIGRGLGVAYQLFILFRARERVAITRESRRWAPDVTKRLLRVSATGMTQFLVGTAAWLGVTRLVALFGDSTLAGYTITIRLIHFAILPSWGVSNAAATLVGQNLGAKRPDRAEKAVYITGFANFGMLAVVAVLFWAFAAPMTGVFTSDPEVLRIGVRSLKIISGGYVFFGFSMVFAQAFNGAGDTYTPTLINLLCYWCWQLPLAYYLSAPLGLGVDGVYYAVIIAGATWALVGFLLFRRGKWKTRTI